jgi:hypothetical protein
MGNTQASKLSNDSSFVNKYVDKTTLQNNKLGEILVSNGNTPSWKSPSEINVNSSSNLNLANSQLGSIPYQTSSNTTSYINPVKSGDLLQSNGINNPPSWKSPSEITVNSSSNLNLANSQVGSIPYQTSSNTTSFINPNIKGYLLQTNGPNSTPSWVNPTTLSVQNAVNATTISGGTAGTILASDGKKSTWTTPANLNLIVKDSKGNINVTKVNNTTISAPNYTSFYATPTSSTKWSATVSNNVIECPNGFYASGIEFSNLEGKVRCRKLPIF